MCAIFGVLDYKGSLTAAQRLRMVRALGNAAEIRGTDATGIAYFQRDKLCIQKAPKPAHKMRFRIPAEVRYIMGHTRMTTQGSAKKNQNNHPFPGRAGNTGFALAHNGVLYNDKQLQWSHSLPKTDIETDSYVAVQLIEAEKELTPDSLRKMAEAVRGSFVFTILDSGNNLWFVKGDNPLTIYHYPKLGLYLYASTVEILDLALKALDMSDPDEVIQPWNGDILRIDSKGRQKYWHFDTGAYYRTAFASTARQDEYIQTIKNLATFLGYEPEHIDALLEDGYTTDELEELIYSENSVY